MTFENSNQNRYYYNYAFKDCVSLTQVGPTANRVQLANNLTTNSEGVFMGCTSIRGIVYRYAQTKIGKEWFKGCTSLTVLNITNASEVGESAFEGCTALTAFNITAGATSSAYTMTFGPNCFKGCTSITYAQFDQIKRAISTIPEGMFEGCINLQYAVSGSNEGDGAKIGDLNGITSIGARAFNGCTAFIRYGKFQNVAIFPADLVEIGASAFEGCSSLKTFYLYKMDAAPTLGEGAFTGIASDAKFYIYPTNSYTAAGKYALDDVWKTFFDGTVSSYPLYAYVNKTKQYGTVSCAVPLYFGYSSTANMYIVTAADNNYAYLKQVSRKVPANTGAIVEMAADGAAFKTSTLVQVLFDGSASASTFTGNLLIANVDENTNFIGHEGDTWNLIMNDGKFVKATDGTLAAGLAYLPREFSGSEAPELALDFEGSTTGITSMDNGQQTIDNGAWYTLNGVQLNGKPAQKGVYIHNGKKVVVK